MQRETHNLQEARRWQERQGEGGGDEGAQMEGGRTETASWPFYSPRQKQAHVQERTVSTAVGTQCPFHRQKECRTVVLIHVVRRQVV